MMTFKQALLGSLIPSILIIFLYSCSVIGTYETITIHSGDTNKEVDVKIDSGAKRTSIDGALAEELNLKVLDESVTVRSASGTEERSLVEIEFTLSGETIKTKANIADRSHLEYPIIIGVMDLENRFLIKPELISEAEEKEEN
jgi:hypothetical protein